MHKFLTTCLLLVMLTGVGFVPAAHAEEGMSTSQRIEALSIQGAESFNDGDFARAADYFEQAYALEPIPNLLFNIGRSYEQLEDWESAKENFQKFLDTPDLDDDARQYAEDKLATMTENLEEQREEERLARQREEEEEARRLAEEEEARAAEEARLRALEEQSNMPAFATMGAGAGLLAGGLLMGMRANGNADRLSDTTLAYDDRVAARSSARTQGLVADGFYIAGAAAMAVGLYMLLSSDDIDDGLDDASMGGLTPWLHGDGAGLDIRLGF